MRRLTMQTTELSTAVERHVEEQAELHISARVEGNRLLLEGRVGSVEASQTAYDLAAVVAVGYIIENDLEVEDLQPEDARHRRVAVHDDLLAVEPTTERWAPEVHDRSDALPSYSAHDTGPGESGESFVPPTDPVIELNARGNPRLLGGFSFSSLDDVSVEESASDPLLGDEALAEAVRRELREDAATTALDIEVEIWDRVAHLRGAIAGPEDAEAAEAVAARVPGVAEVADDLVIADAGGAARTQLLDEGPPYPMLAQ
jgi:osmotically-inducible protein OsmY